MIDAIAAHGLEIQPHQTALVAQVKISTPKTPTWAATQSSEYSHSLSDWQMTTSSLPIQLNMVYRIQVKTMDQSDRNFWKIIIGCSSQHVTTKDLWLGVESSTWGYVANGEKIHFSSSSAADCGAYFAGDIINVKVSDNGQVSLWKEGTTETVAFSNVPTNTPMYLCASLSGPGHAICIL